MNIKPYIVTIFFTSVFFISLKAQDEERYRSDTTLNVATPTNNVQFLRLRKSYSLGDGIALRGATGGLVFTQSLQTLFSFNSVNKNLSNGTSGFEIRRARLTMVCNLFSNKLSTVFRVNFPANYQSVTTGSRSFNNPLQEAFIEYRPNRKHVFNFGLRADYIDSRETRIEGESLGFTERSAVSGAFDAIFDYGLRYKGRYRLGGKKVLKPYFSITTGDSRSSLSRNFGGFKYGTRIDFLPFDEFVRGGEYYMEDLQREQKPKLVIGVIASYNDGATSAFGVNGGRFIYGDSLQNVLLPKFTKIGFDYLFKYKGFYSMGSLFSTQSSVPDNIKGEFRLNGTFNRYALSQTNQQTQNVVLNRLNIGTGFNMQMGYVFPSDVAVGFRYSQLNSNTQSAKFDEYNKFYSLVFTKYLSDHNCKFQIELGYDRLNDPIKKLTQDGNYYSQFMFTIQL